MLIPTVIERTERGERAYDVYSRLLQERIIFFGEELTADLANVVIAQMLHLQAEDANKDIRLYINSPGGDMNALFAVYDTMQVLTCDVATVCIGQAASAAAVILAGGARGKRLALPTSRVLIHQPHGGAQGQSTDLELAVKEMVLLRDRMVQCLAEDTGQDTEQVRADIDRDFILRGDEAVTYGLVDQVLTKPPAPGDAIAARRSPPHRQGADVAPSGPGVRLRTSRQSGLPGDRPVPRRDGRLSHGQASPESSTRFALVGPLGSASQPAAVISSATT